MLGAGQVDQFLQEVFCIDSVERVVKRQRASVQIDGGAEDGTADDLRPVGRGMLAADNESQTLEVVVPLTREGRRD